LWSKIEIILIIDKLRYCLLITYFFFPGKHMFCLMLFKINTSNNIRIDILLMWVKHNFNSYFIDINEYLKYNTLIWYKYNGYVLCIEPVWYWNLVGLTFWKSSHYTQKITIHKTTLETWVPIQLHHRDERLLLLLI